MPMANNPVVDVGYNSHRSVSAIVRERLQNSNKRYYASDNIADFISTEEKNQLIDEATEKFEAVLDTLLIDRQNDPNSRDTGRRMAKMYINELMAGRYEAEPDATAFPNDDPETRYSGLIVTRVDIKSMCSHHHQIVDGVAWIGILPGTRVIGLSKYARIAQWCARRGTLQEELTREIAKRIMEHTGTEDVAVYMKLRHGCCENRGIMAKNSSTHTSILHGQFYNPSVKEEFYNQVKMDGMTCN